MNQSSFGHAKRWKQMKMDVHDGNTFCSLFNRIRDHLRNKQQHARPYVRGSKANVHQIRFVIPGELQRRLQQQHKHSFSP